MRAARRVTTVMTVSTPTRIARCQGVTIEKAGGRAKGDQGHRKTESDSDAMFSCERKRKRWSSSAKKTAVWALV
jgi:hypothetical protein